MFDTGRLSLDPEGDGKVACAKIQSARIGYRDVIVSAVEGKPVTELSRGPSRAVDEGSGMTRSRTICACRAAALVEGERGDLIWRRRICCYRVKGQSVGHRSVWVFAP